MKPAFTIFGKTRMPFAVFESSLAAGVERYRALSAASASRSTLWAQATRGAIAATSRSVATNAVSIGEQRLDMFSASFSVGSYFFLSVRSASSWPWRAWSMTSPRIPRQLLRVIAHLERADALVRHVAVRAGDAGPGVHAL